VAPRGVPPTLCGVHSKDLEAFCENDKVMLCISCIIENDHKNHDLSSIDKAAQKEKTVIQSTINNLSEIKKQVADGLNDVSNISNLITIKANKNVKAVEDFFQQIIGSLLDRKELLKGKITTLLEKETDAIKKLEDYITYQLDKIDEFINLNDKIDEKSDLEILYCAKENNNVLNQMLADFPKIKKEDEIKFYELNKTEEITYLNVMLNKLLLREGSSPKRETDGYETNKRQSVDRRVLELGKITKKPVKSNSLKCTPDIGVEKYMKPKLSNKMVSPVNALSDKKLISRPEIPRDRFAVKRRESKSRSSKLIVRIFNLFRIS
jgi:hypothetical protein